MMFERTRQQLDPVGSADSRRVWEIIAVATLVYAVVRTVNDWVTIAYVPLAILSLAIIAIAIVLVLVWSVPSRAPFTRSRHLAIHLIVLAAMAASVWSRHDGAFEIHGDPAPLVLGALIVAVSPYRPVQEIAAMGLVSSTIAGFLVLVEVSSADTVLPALIYVLPSVTPILALAIGGAIYTDGLIRSIERRREPLDLQTLTRAVDDGTVRSDRVAILSRGALPLLRTILDSGRVTEPDRVEAERIAQSLRGMLVAEADRTWLVSSQDDRGGVRFSVVDEHGLANRMQPAQRTVLRALLDSFLGDSRFLSGVVTLGYEGQGAAVTVDVRFGTGASGPSSGPPAVSAMLSIMKTVFAEVESSRDPARVLVKFGYEPR